MFYVKRGVSWRVIILAFVYSDGCNSIAILKGRETSPALISIVPTQNWDGNDGPWSSFGVQIGTPPQSFSVLVGTSSTQTWAVTTEGCGSGDPTQCPEDRGGLWNRNNSLTYVPNRTNSTTDIYGLGLEANLGYTGKGRYGFDTVQAGWSGSGPVLKNQTVAGIAIKSFFMGMFGLKPRPSQFYGSNDTYPSFLESLKKEKQTPSISWGYTAGNQYRLTGSTPGSLTLGGYDTSKFIRNELTFPFSDDPERDLIVQVQKIITNTGTALLPTPIGAFLDSAVPYIYLPVEACELFEKEFEITWNATSQLYLVNDIKHTLLLARNPNITFSIGSSTESVDITFPYAAFDLTASYPLADPSTRYFPLRRAANDTQYTLGRTFFQEAYVIADYERSNFSVSQCSWNARASQNLVAILPQGTTSSSKFPIAAIAGIAAGGALIIGLIALWFFWWRPRKQKRKTAELDSNPLYQRIQPNEPYIKAELDAGEPQGKPGIFVSSPPAEMGESEQIYEMAAREEVAFEMGGLAPIEEREGGSSQRGSKRSSRTRSRQPTIDTFGFPGSPGSRTVSSATSSLRISPGSRESPVLSPASSDNTRRNFNR